MDYRETGELSWCPSWSKSLWQGWSCGLVHFHVGNATDPIWRVLPSSDGISSWISFKPQHSKPNPNPLANQLWCIDILPTPLIIPHELPVFHSRKTRSLWGLMRGVGRKSEYQIMPLKNWCSIHARWSKSSLKHSISFCGIFSKFKT